MQGLFRGADRKEGIILNILGSGKWLVNKYQPFIESIPFYFFGIDRLFELRVESRLFGFVMMNWSFGHFFT
jgi:hypothetical protein